MNETLQAPFPPRARIAGWLVAPVAVLWLNLILVARVLLQVANRPANSRVIYAALFVDIAIGCGCVWLLRLLSRRDPRFPGHYAAFNLLVYSAWTLAIFLAGIGAHMPWLAVGLQNLFLTPYILKSERVRRTFPPISDRRGLWEKLRDRAGGWPAVVLAAAMLGLLLLILALGLLLGGIA